MWQLLELKSSRESSQRVPTCRCRQFPGGAPGRWDRHKAFWDGQQVTGNMESITIKQQVGHKTVKVWQLLIYKSNSTFWLLKVKHTTHFQSSSSNLQHKRECEQSSCSLPADVWRHIACYVFNVLATMRLLSTGSTQIFCLLAAVCWTFSFHDVNNCWSFESLNRDEALTW